MTRKTKIVCTIGPAVDSKEMLRKLMLAGMNVGRINFSHGNYVDQEDRINMFKEVRDELKLPIPLLLDTKGPEIRIGKFAEKQVYLEDGKKFTLLNEDVLGDNTKVSVTYKDLYKDVDIGKTILVNDGTIELKVIEIREKDIECEIIHGGVLTNSKSINIPDLKLNLPSITEKDIEDIKYGIKVGFDYIAASFVRKKEDVLAIRKVLKENNGEHIKIISKIENREGINNFDEILEVSDGIMVARGDLGVEIPMEEVPVLQKQFIKKTYRAAKPVITATQRLESMVNKPRPTRAEVSDVANAIYDGSSAIMLSAETAMGSYPVECVQTMDKIARKVESSIKYWKRFRNREYNESSSNYEFHICHSICANAMNIDAKVIFAYTQKGDTPRLISSFGPQCPVYAITDNEITYRQLGLAWNIIPNLFGKQEKIENMLQLGIETAKEQGLINKGDFVIISGGAPVISNVTEENRVIGGVLKV